MGGGMMPGMGGPGMGGGMMPGMGGPGMGMSTGQEVAKYKLIRFYDFEADPTKVYRYRVRALIQDPNHPQDPDFAPDPRSLSTAVAQRVKQVEDQDAKGDTRTFWRTTEWSEPSGTATLPKPIQFVAGKVINGRMLEIREQKLSIPLDEPSASLLPVVWEPNRATQVPGFTDIPKDPKDRDKEKPSTYRGTVLNFKRDARVLRPDTLEIKLIEQFPFKTNAIVVDVRPAEPIRDGDRKPTEKKEPPASAGEILILDGDGRFVVRNELDDVEDFRRLLLVGEEKAAGSAAGGMGGMPGMPGGGMPGADGADSPMGGSPPGGSPPGKGGKKK